MVAARYFGAVGEQMLVTRADLDVLRVEVALLPLAHLGAVYAMLP